MPDFIQAMSAIDMIPHSEQRIMADAMRVDGEAGMVSLVESPPATGKTLALAWHALDLADRTGERVLIAVPSLAVMVQMLGAVRRLADASYDSIGVSAIHGRQEYVNRDRARSWLEARMPAALEDYDRWAALQDDKGWTRTSLDSALRSAGFDVDLPPETSILGRKGSTAEASYRRQFETAAKVLVATHAFLARDVASRVGPRGADETDATAVVEANERRLRMETAEDRILPRWSHLIVDEAHQLAANFMLALTTKLSYRRLLRILDDRQAAGAAISERTLANLHRAVGIMEQAAPATGVQRTMRLTMENKYHTAIVRCVEGCIPEDPSVLGADDGDTTYLQRFRDAAVLAQRHRRATAPSITWSDVNSHLGLSIMPLTFARQLDFCFRSCRSAVLASATLYSEGDEQPQDHIVRQLALPVDRIHAHQAIQADWQTAPVVLHLPTHGSSLELIPTEKGWIKGLSRFIASAVSEVQGGTLVLFTSHKTIADIVDEVKDPNGRIMLTDERGVASTAARFSEAAANGQRPVWLATGPAWTGLDLPDVSLDALVITRLPFGLANPVMQNHLHGLIRTKSDYHDTETDMLKILRQGMGRLVRSRSDDRPRHLWIADGRIAATASGRRAKDLMSRYGSHVPYEGLIPQDGGGTDPNGKEAVTKTVTPTQEQNGNMNKTTDRRSTRKLSLTERKGRRVRTRKEASQEVETSAETARTTPVADETVTDLQTTPPEAMNAQTARARAIGDMIRNLSTEEIMRLSRRGWHPDAVRIEIRPEIDEIEYRPVGSDSLMFRMGSYTKETSNSTISESVACVFGIVSPNEVVALSILPTRWSRDQKPTPVSFDEFDQCLAVGSRNEFPMTVRGNVLGDIGIDRTDVSIQDLIDLLALGHRGFTMADLTKRYTIAAAMKLSHVLTSTRPYAGEVTGRMTDWAGWPEYDAKVLAESMEYGKKQRRKAAEMGRYLTGRERLEPEAYENIKVNEEADAREVVALLHEAMIRPGVPGAVEVLMKEALEILTIKPKKPRKKG